MRQIGVANEGEAPNDAMAVLAAALAAGKDPAADPDSGGEVPP
jgi:hypothetical protein